MKHFWLRAVAAAGLMALPTCAWAADETKPAEKAPGDAKPAQGDRGGLFDRLDKNSDGFVTSDEVPEQNQRMFERTVRLADKDKDGKLSRDEFVNAPEPERKPAPPGGSQDGQRGGQGGGPRAEDIMNRADGENGNKDGKLDRNEIPEERRDFFDRMVESSDKDKDGKLDLEELRAGLAGMRGEAQPKRPESATSDNKDSKDGKDSKDAKGDEKSEPRRPAAPGAGGDFAKNLMEQQDKNKDGKLGKDETGPRMTERFDEIDKNKDGFIDQEELRQVMGGMRRPDQPGAPGQAGGEMAKQMIGRLDKNSDGKLSKDEMPEQMRDGFDRLDKNKDGFIDQEELQQIRRPGGTPGTPGTPGAGRPGAKPEAAGQGMMQRLDKNKDGKISKDEAPGQMRENFDRNDQNKDGFIDAEELRSIMVRQGAG